MAYRFFLGGRDLEMAEIRVLLDRHAPGWIEDKHLAWGAKTSDYQAELLAALVRDETPVLIELQDDLPLAPVDQGRVVIVDHHGVRAGAGEATSIEQVWRLLGLPAADWPRRLALVAANDRAHVAGLIAMGATPAEVAEIRSADRMAQGVTPADEAEAGRAIAARCQDGKVTVIETGGSTSSAIADRILPALGGPGYERLLVAMPREVAVFADGAAIRELADAYPESWWGGDLPNAGFWGMALPAAGNGTVSGLVDRLR